MQNHSTKCSNQGSCFRGFANPLKFWLGGAEYPWHPPIIELNFFFNSLFFEHSQTKFSVLINKYFFVSFQKLCFCISIYLIIRIISIMQLFGIPHFYVLTTKPPSTYTLFYKSAKEFVYRVQKYMFSYQVWNLPIAMKSC